MHAPQPAPQRHLAPVDDPRVPPMVVVQAPEPRRGILGTAVQVVGLLLLLTLLAGMAVMVFALASLLAVPSQLSSGVGGLGQQVQGAAAQAGRSLNQAVQSARDATDLARPPTGLQYDTEVSGFRTFSVGSALPGGTTYLLTVKEIRRRESAPSAETALYAVIQSELREPRETRILGQVVRTDRDTREHVLYKGEVFRIGREYYRVNWVSLEQKTIAVVTYRSPDTVTAPLKLAFD